MQQRVLQNPTGSATTRRRTGPYTGSSARIVATDAAPTVKEKKHRRMGACRSVLKSTFSNSTCSVGVYREEVSKLTATEGTSRLEVGYSKKQPSCSSSLTVETYQRSNQMCPVSRFLKEHLCSTPLEVFLGFRAVAHFLSG